MECHHAHKGLFAGLLLVMATLVALALFYTYNQRNGHAEALTVFQVTDITLLSIGILAVSIALFQLRVLGVRQLSGDGAFDDDLLLIGLLGILFYNMFLLVPAMEGKAIKKITGIMFVSKSVLELLQALMQVGLSGFHVSKHCIDDFNGIQIKNIIMSLQHNSKFYF